MRHKRWLALVLLILCATQALPARAADLTPRRGQKSEAVDDLQRQLTSYGFYFVPQEERYSTQTALAVQRYQQHLIELRELDEFARLLFPDPIKADGRITRAQHDYLFSGVFVPYLDPGPADPSESVRRVQIRLDALGYFEGKINGLMRIHTVWALTAFQRANGLPETGQPDKDTLTRLFGSHALPCDAPTRPYQLFIDRFKQRAYVYAWTGDGYALDREMVCSTGLPNTPTPDGVFSAEGAVSRWCYFPVYGCWAQYAYRIEGAVLFHSVLYEHANEETLRQSSLKTLGRKSSHGCVRLTVEDSRWIYDHCPTGTTVIVY